MPQNKGGFTIGENNPKENSGFSVNMGPLTALNFDAKRAALNDLKAALPGIILGKVRRSHVTEQFSEDTDPVTDVSAQRENKWLVTLVDDTQFLDVANTIANTGYGERFTITVPTAKSSLLPVGQETLNLADGGVVEAFVTALEAVANSPTGGNEVHVESIQYVGRNL